MWSIRLQKGSKSKTSPYKISTLSSKELMRIKKTINMQGKNSYQCEWDEMKKALRSWKKVQTQYKPSVIYIKHLFAFFLSGFLSDQKIEGRHWRHIKKLGHFRPTHMKHARNQCNTDWEIFSSQKVGRIKCNFFPGLKGRVCFPRN